MSRKPNLESLRDNTLAVFDVETTGRRPWFHEVCQLAIVAVDCNLEPTTHYYSNVKPRYPSRIQAEAISTHGLWFEQLEMAPLPEIVADDMWEWFRRLNLPPGKKLIPLCHNGQFDIPHLTSFLGEEMFDEMFGHPARDSMSLVAALQDKAAFNGDDIELKHANLGYLCERLGIELTEAHDALEDALATLKVYRALLARGRW